MKEQSPEHRAKRTLVAAQDALRHLTSSLAGVRRAVKLIEGRKGDIIVTGIGKSGFIGQKCAASLTSLGEKAFFIHPTEALHGDFGMLSKGDVLIALSFSGETKEVVSIAKYAKKNFAVPVIALCKSSNSSLGKIADSCVPIVIRSEGSPNGIAPMASTTAMLVVCDMIAASVMSINFKDEHFAAYHPGGALGLRLKRVEELMKKGIAIPKVKETDTFLRAVKEINDKRMGITAVIGAHGKITGAITDGDIRRFVLRNKLTSSATAKNTMTLKPKCVQATDSLEKALDAMESYKITSAFVLDARGKLVGVIHIHDIIEHTIV
ncbi:MAG: KpsF/GutQ family sugar-phosphate isomerase [Patescibacteria group bacterium]|nr:KpsF/GutQ family sugar-phosphate isomerase [Patescibacteria group bacterium]